MKKTFNKILIANRGEIALRVMRTCKEMGISTVAIYSDADKNSIHTRYADESYNVGPGPSAQSYLKMDTIIEIAKKTGAQAIHPGYGFLAENPEFAKRCEMNAITFIGPSSWSLAKAGDKNASRKLVRDIGIHVTPGSKGAVEDSEALEIARSIGFPIILKSSAGGGGMGIGVVEKEDDLKQTLEIARSTAFSAFGNSDILIEKYLKNPRHIEFQILADNHGNIIHLGERECSVQRRYQKLIEEAPSVICNDKLREEIGARSIKIARAARYVNAGTIEYLYHDGEFYFNEINARLQVEHPVTELVTGVDLVEWQIRIASGEKLPFSQTDIIPRGWAMECRINAEDPYNNFIPSPGTVVNYTPPASIGTRIDSGIESGSIISSFYDSLLAKACVWGESRSKVLTRMKRILNEFTIEGITTNIPFFKKVFDNPAFNKGKIDTNFIKNSGIIDTILREGENYQQKIHQNAAIAAVAIALSENGVKGYQVDKNNTCSCKNLSNWKMAGRAGQIGQGRF